jgi:hypothetical protein
LGHLIASMTPQNPPVTKAFQIHMDERPIK